jgi:nitroreductase
VREFGPGKIDLKKFEQAVQIATLTPSVCNRQSARVHLLTDPNTIREVLRYQGGLAGYPTPPALAVVTSDLSAFLSTAERRQPWIDGGLFAMSLLNALEYSNLAACPLHAMMSGAAETRVRALAALPDNEAALMFIGIGNKPETTTVPHSARLSPPEISIVN